jgi:hypothetical protein
VPYLLVAFQDPLLDTTDPVFTHLFQITERLGMLATGMAGADSLSLHFAGSGACSLISLVVNPQLHCYLRCRLGLLSVLWRLLLSWKYLLEQLMLTLVIVCISRMSDCTAL